ncbi:MAG: hypothetical protein DMG07_09610, partial [Acidobacteria bacterium]
AVRFAIYGGLGGYPPLHGRSVHFHLSGHAAYLLIRNVTTLPIWGVNVVRIPTVLLVAAAAMFAVVALQLRGCRRGFALVMTGLLVATALPTWNVVGWIGSSLLHGRYLYLPSAWMSLLMGDVFSTARRPLVCIGLFVSICALALLYNLLSAGPVYARFFAG